MSTRLSKENQEMLIRWPEKYGIPIFPADPYNKEIHYNGWQDLDFSKVDFRKEMLAGKFDNGAAARLGQTLNEGVYAIALDFDSWDAVIAWFGSWENVVVHSKKSLIEWHLNMGKIHVVLFTTEPIPNKRIFIGKNKALLEIRCEKQALFISPSPHKDGNKYEPLGTTDIITLRSNSGLLQLKAKIDSFSAQYMSDDDKQRFNAWLDDDNTIIGEGQGRHDVTKFKVCSYFWKYSGEWLDLTDEQRFELAWQWHLKHCRPPRTKEHFYDICRWVKSNHKVERDKKHASIREEQRKAKEAQRAEITIISVSEALRILPSDERGEKKHTAIILVRGMISSTRQVIKMIVGVYSKCPKCNKLKYKRLDKPVFVDKDIFDFEVVCEEDSTLHDVKRDWKTDEIAYDKKTGAMLYERPVLDKWYEYRNATIIEVQDMDKFDDLERLPVILFDDDTIDIKAGEQVLVKGVIYIEKFTKMDYSLHSRLYSHSITYEARKEISLSSQDIEAIKRFVSKHGNNIVNVISSRMFAPDVIGLYNIKKGLILCAASCANDAKKQRQRMHSLLIGEPGVAKSMLLKKTVEIVPNSRQESAQNSSGKSLTAIVSKEGGTDTVLRLGPIPFAKEAICGLNELGRMSFDDQAPLLDVMEEGEFTINKYGMNAHIRSPTVIIGSANPTGSKWSNTNDAYGRINLDDIPAIKPLIDRFDFVFVVRMSRDERVVMEYAQAKSKYEDNPPPNYNAYLEKHLIYARRFNPKMSPEATYMLNQFYSGVIKNMGSPRVRETLFKTARMIARLKLKKIVDSNDAREACEFYNVILQEYDRAVFVPPDPMETAVNECIYTLEANVNPMLAEDMISKTCERVEYVRTFLGCNYKTRNNKRVRKLIDRILEDSRVERIQLKPVVLRLVRRQSERVDEVET